jgi:thiol-disulfide isomerase/thioredoxin
MNVMGKNAGGGHSIGDTVSAHRACASRAGGRRAGLAGVVRAVLGCVGCFVAGAGLALVSWSASGQPSADVPGPLPAESLVVRGIDGVLHGFDELLGTDGRAVCFAFLHPACPLAQEYAPVLTALAAEFAGRGIRVVGVVCEGDTPEDIAVYRRDFGITFPIHLDLDFQLAEALDATTTPEVVLVDRDRHVVYSGRIDDRYKIRGVMTPGDAQPELEYAIDDLLAGRAIREPRTTPAGCPLDRPERPAPGRPVAAGVPTFHRDVLPFLHAHCQLCHAPGQAGPFNLLTYDDAVEWVDIGIEELDARRMPPAQIESDLDYAGPKPPTAAEIAMLRAWVAAGKPKGDAADTPVLEPLPDYSAFQEDLGPPDMVIDLSEPTQIGAHGNDLYRNLVFRLNRDEDLFVRAFQFLPGNRRVVHHALLGYLPRPAVDEAIEKFGGREGFQHPDDSGGGFWDTHGVGFRVPPAREDGQPRSAFIGGFVPGVRATVAPPGSDVVIPAGCDILTQMHYVRTGKKETDSSRMGLWLAKDKPRKVLNVVYVSGEFAVVPAGVTDFRVSGSWTIRQDAELVGIVPHAHQLARWIEVRAFEPDAESPLMVLRVPQWDYNWQSAYYLREPRRFAAGTRFEAACSFDNSAGNPRNPFDPPQNVWHNETIHDEMLLPVLSFTSETPLDGTSDSFFRFWASTRRAGFLKRLVEHRYRHVFDADGTVRVAEGQSDGGSEGGSGGPSGGESGVQ